MPITPTFPLSVHSSGRYLIDAAGNPFRVHGDAAWSLPFEINLTSVRQYLDDRVARGFNSILVQLTSSTQAFATSVAPANWNGDKPFSLNSSGGSWSGTPGSSDADFSSTNNAYWSNVDSAITEANSRGIAVFATYCYLGFGLDGTQGWATTVTNSANTATVCTNFGSFLGNRYKTFKNIVWVSGGDAIPVNASTLETRHHNMATAIRAAGATQLQIAHWAPDQLSTNNVTFQDVLDMNSTYTDGSGFQGPSYGRGRDGYAHSPATPAIMLESSYEGEHSLTAAQSRMIQWGAALSNIAGSFFGNNPIWDFDTGWQTALGASGSKHMTILGNVLNALPWHQLVPDALAGSATIITSGQGTFTTMASAGDPETGGADWIVAAISPAGNCMVAYVPDTHTGAFTVATSLMTGRVRGRWIDPTNGVPQAASGSPFGFAASRSFTTPGLNAGGDSDWVLILDTDPSATISKWLPASTSSVRR